MRSISLNCLAGPLKGQILRLTGGPVFIFGRYAKAHFNLSADPAASHLHFLIDISENRVRVADLGSTNGLVINERHIGGKRGVQDKEFITLKADDTLLAGSNLFRVFVEEENSVAAPDENERQAERMATSSPENKSSDGTASFPITPECGTAADKDKGYATDILELSRELPRIEGFSIIGKIGKGGKGVIYKAVKNDTNVAVAIKMMIFNRGKSKKLHTLDMFRREIQITKQLEHPNIIGYIGDGISQGLPYLALEYADGGNLDEMLHRRDNKRMELAEAIPIFIQILEAVSYMHQRRFVHRDIKPKNVLFNVKPDTDLQVKLSDMGLSCHSSNEDNDDFPPIISEGGTAAYMPPEQLTDLTRAVPQSDVFSAAATLYQMLAGTFPYDFSCKEQNVAIMEGDIKPILYLRPDLPLSVANVVSKGLSYNLESRYADATEMLYAFKQALP